MSLGVNVTPQEIMAIIDRLIAHRNHDKNSLCEGLAATGRCVIDWFNKINDMFNGANWEEKDNYSKLKKFIKQQDYEPVATRCRTYLKYVKADYDHKKLQKNLLRILDMHSNVNKIDEIMLNIDLFQREAEANDKIIYDKIIAAQPVSVEEINGFITYMIDALKGFSKNVNTRSAELIEEVKRY